MSYTHTKDDMSTQNGAGIFDDIAHGIVEGVKLLGGRIAVLEEHFDVPELEHHEYIEKFTGSGFEHTLWDTAKTVLKHPVTKNVLTAAIPIAIKVLAGRVAHLEEHMEGSGYQASGYHDSGTGSGYKIAGKATTKKRGGEYAVAGELDLGGEYAVAGKATTKKRGGAYAIDEGGEYTVAGKVTKKRGGNLGTTASSKPPIHQRTMTLTDLLE